MSETMTIHQARIAVDEAVERAQRNPTIENMQAAEAALSRGMRLVTEAIERQNEAARNPAAVVAEQADALLIRCQGSVHRVRRACGGSAQ